MLHSKKGQQITLQTVSVVIITIIVVGLIATFAAQITDDVNDDFGSTSLSTTVNESFTNNGTLANVGTPTIGNNIDNVSEVITNNSQGNTTELVSNTHYELSDRGVFNVLTDVAGLPDTDWDLNVTYNFTVFAEDAAFNASRNTLTSIINLTGQFGNLGTIVGAALIIGLLLVAFAVSRSGAQFR